MRRRRPKFTKLEWTGNDYPQATLALARVVAVSYSYQNGSVTFDDVAEALAADGLESPPAAVVFVPGMFIAVGQYQGRAAWKAV